MDITLLKRCYMIAKDKEFISQEQYEIAMRKLRGDAELYCVMYPILKMCEDMQQFIKGKSQELDEIATTLDDIRRDLEKIDIRSIKRDIRDIKKDIKDLQHDVRDLDKRVTKLEKK